VTPMHVAASAGHADILSLLLEHGADVDGRGIIGATPLHRASRRGKLEAGQCLLDRGADINARDRRWLDSTVYMRRTKDMSSLLECYLNAGQGLMPGMTLGETPLHWAVRGRTFKSCDCYWNTAQMSMRDKSGKTPSQLTRQQEIVELLSEYGAESVELNTVFQRLSHDPLSHSRCHCRASLST
jgi:hypothetical protein